MSWDYLDMPDNIDMQPLHEDEMEPEDDIEESYTCVIHGPCSERECPRC